MCKGQPSIAICECGASFAACDTVEALLHITQASGNSHSWVFIDTGVWTAGRRLDPAKENPANFKEYLMLKYKIGKKAGKAMVFIAVFLSSIVPQHARASYEQPSHRTNTHQSVRSNHLLDWYNSSWYRYLDYYVLPYDWPKAPSEPKKGPAK